MSVASSSRSASSSRACGAKGLITPSEPLRSDRCVISPARTSCRMLYREDRPPRLAVRPFREELSMATMSASGSSRSTLVERARALTESGVRSGFSG